MTPQERANELVERFTEKMNHTLDVSYSYSSVENIDLAAKECALICVDEIMEANHITEFGYPNTIYTVETLTGGRQFWEEVKKAIEAM